MSRYVGYVSVTDAAARLGISRQRLHQIRAKQGSSGPITDAEMADLITRPQGRPGRPKRTTVVDRAR